MPENIPRLEAVSAQVPSPEEQHRSYERNYWGRQIGVAIGLNWISGIAAVVGIFGLILVVCGLRESRRATVEANRAWLAPVWNQLSFEQPNLIFNIKLVNFGREPAVDVGQSTATHEFVDVSNNEALEKIRWPDVDSCIGVRTKPHGMVVYPLQTDSPDNPTFQFNIPITADPKLAADLIGFKNGTRGILLVGCFAYLTFGEPRHSQFCFLERKLVDGTYRATACKSGAYAD
jgi:hypothetical protein